MTEDHKIAWTPITKRIGDSVRIVAADPNSDEKLDDANLFKFKPDGQLYVYHTVNRELGLRVVPTSGRLRYLGNI